MIGGLFTAVSSGAQLIVNRLTYPSFIKSQVQDLFTVRKFGVGKDNNFSGWKYKSRREKFDARIKEIMSEIFDGRETFA